MEQKILARSFIFFLSFISNLDVNVISIHLIMKADFFSFIATILISRIYFLECNLKHFIRIFYPLKCLLSIYLALHIFYHEIYRLCIEITLILSLMFPFKLIQAFFSS